MTSLFDSFIEDVRNAAEVLGMTPSTLIQKAAQRGGLDWRRWEQKTSSPTLLTADQILKFISEEIPDFEFGSQSPEVAE